jgi:hypothetical protein
MIDKSSLPGILWGDAGKRDGYLYSLSEKSPLRGILRRERLLFLAFMSIGEPVFENWRFEASVVPTSRNLPYPDASVLGTEAHQARPG